MLKKCCGLVVFVSCIVKKKYCLIVAVYNNKQGIYSNEFNYNYQQSV